MILGRYRQQSYDRRRRVIDFEQFLIEGETIVGPVTVIVTPETDPPFVVDGVTLDTEAQKLVYYAGGGVDGETYKAEFRTTTSLAQRREDEIEFEVEEE